ncbi:NYN domain-containing protein [Oceanobacillus jeddahense]|uniref:NYN domain-containing protein n=1 Tax=Oceanobacillus jeddahense TaxID=1462527 RepID=A0ABY5JSE1_9BACI|nr:NYN domain-containing protein [Oceanobacillus jeddahense]UUI03253.1 NYN domain-containing protein [Oceanobacillus jeddahense]
MVVLIVDGYNIIGAWPELEQLKEKDIGQARDRLIELLAEYQAFTGDRVIVVFDAYYVRGIESKEKQYKVEVIYTKEKETADECIEKLVKTVKNIQTQVYVATSDYAEQRTIFGQGALRKSARELQIEMEDMNQEIRVKLEVHQKEKPSAKIPINQDLLKRFEEMRRGK